MIVSEWAKVPTLSASIGAFRHGVIEIAQSGLGAVVFAAPGRTHISACALATELSEYGAHVLIVENGHARSPAETASQEFVLDEFLSPILDVMPAQLFAEALAQHLGISPRFRHISKVVTQL